MSNQEKQNADAILETIERLRKKLLDLSLRNPLLNFKHTGRSMRCVRAIDELPDELYNRLEEKNAVLRFKSIGPRDDVPEDEKRIEFRRALDAAKLGDVEYIKALEDAGEDPGERMLVRLEAELREKVRASLGMRKRSSVTAQDAQETAIRRGINPSFSLPKVNGEISPQHKDEFIQTLLFDDQLDKVLGSLREDARSSLEEMGINALFGAFGFLEWFDADSSETPLHAPLLLLPLEIDRELRRATWDYSVKSSGEGAMVNVSLAEKMKQDFGILLPPFLEEDTPESYWDRVVLAITSKTGWRVQRWFSIGFFNFSKIAMYQDLAPDRWMGTHGLSVNTGIRNLLIGNSTAPMMGSGDNEQQTTSHAADQVEMDIPLVMDADSSQLEAIQKVLSGRNLVIEGPPGTGKSQTITNMIAAAISQGKSVLFVAEKAAALNVVKTRLEAADLGDFCFELHSNKLARKEIYTALGRRLQHRDGRRHASAQDTELDSVKSDLRSCRSHLSDFVQALAAPAGKFNLDVQELIWRAQNCRDETKFLPESVDEIWLRDVDGLTRVDIERKQACANLLTQAYGVVE